MSSKLSSLLVQDGVVSVKRMEEAFQRQVIFGGNLDTILLEMNVIDEAVLLKYLHASSGIAPADLTGVDYTVAQEQTRLFPRKLAEKYLIVPVSMAGGALRVLLTDPPDRGRLDELGFMLGVAIQPAIVPEFRIFQALELIYGVKMPLRYAGLVKRLGPPPRPEGLAVPPSAVAPVTAPEPVQELPEAPAAQSVHAPAPLAPEVQAAPASGMDGGWDDPFAGAKPDTLVGLPYQTPPEGTRQPTEPDTTSQWVGETGMPASASHVQPIPPTPETPGTSIAARELKRTMVGVPLRDLEPGPTSPLGLADSREGALTSSEGVEDPSIEGSPTAAWPEPEPEDHLAGLEAFQRQPEPETFQPQPDSWAQPEPETNQPQPDSWAQPEPETYQPQPEPETFQPQPDSWAQPEPETYQPQPEPETFQPQPDSWAQPEPETYQPQPEPETFQPQPESWAQPEPEAWPKPEPEPYQPQPESWAQPEPEAWPKPEPEPYQPQPESWAQPEFEPYQPQPEAWPKPEPEPYQPQPEAWADSVSLEDMPFDPRPLGFEEAVAALAEAQDRDEIFALLLRAVAGTFEYAVVLTLFGDQAVGRMAIQRGVADMERVGQVSIPLSLPSVFRTTVESKGYYFGPIYDEGINFGLLADLQRPVPASAFIMPVLIRNRVVCLLYADDGLRPVDPAWPESLVFISYQISQAFQRLILKAKRVQYSAASPGPADAGKVDLSGALPRRRSASSDAWQAASPASSGPASTRAPVVEGVLKEVLTPAMPPPPPVQPAFPELPRQERSSPMTVSATSRPPEGLGPGKASPPSLDREGRAITSVGFYSLTEPQLSDEVRGEVRGAGVVGGITAGEVMTGPPGMPSRRVTGESPVKIDAEARVQPSATPAPRTEDIWSLIDDLERGGPEGDLAAAALQRLGEPALKLVAFRFPGRLYQERMGQHGKLPPPSAHGPLVHFMVRMRERGVPFLADLLKSDNPEVRYYATYVFAELHVPQVLPLLMERVFDPAPPVRRITVEVFKQYLVDLEMRAVLEHLRAELVSPSPFRRRSSAEVLGALRDVSAVPRLIELAADRDPETSEAAQRALLLITKQAFGDSRGKWHKWWEKNQRRHRVQWLIDALSHKESECRFLASQELHQLTGETLGYRFDQEKREREEAVARWERWWESRGRPRFVSL